MVRSPAINVLYNSTFCHCWEKVLTVQCNTSKLLFYSLCQSLLQAEMRLIIFATGGVTVGTSLVQLDPPIVMNKHNFQASLSGPLSPIPFVTPRPRFLFFLVTTESTNH